MVIFETAITFEVVITVVFWTFLFNPAQPVSLRYYYTRLVHSTPLLCLAMEFIYNKWVFRIQQFPIIVLPGIAYIGVNYEVTKVTGVPVYSILTWDSNLTYIVLGGITVLYVLSFLIFNYISAMRHISES
jgi:hypothetical protein